DERDLLLRRCLALRLVAEVDEARLLVAALGDGEVHAHAELAALLRAEHLELEAVLLGDLAGDVGEPRRREIAGRLVDEVARERHAVGNLDAALRAALERLEAPAVDV